MCGSVERFISLVWEIVTALLLTVFFLAREIVISFIPDSWQIRLFAPRRKLTGRVALITGGGGGIARYIGLYLMKANAAAVVLVDCNAERLEASADFIEQETGGQRRPITLQCDVSDAQQVRLLKDRVAQQLQLHNDLNVDATKNLGNDVVKIKVEDVEEEKSDNFVSIVVNNAAVVAPAGMRIVDEQCLDYEKQLERLMGVNVLSQFWGAHIANTFELATSHPFRSCAANVVQNVIPERILRTFLPDMITRRRGHIVTLASVVNFVGADKCAGYCASKHAVLALHDALKCELDCMATVAKVNHLGINCTVVCPYVVDTGLFAGFVSRFNWLIPVLKPDYVGRKTVNAILLEKNSVFLPLIMYPLIALR